MINRSGYTLLDLIANVGGLRTIMAFVISVLMSYWNFNSGSNYMVSRLFTYQGGEDDRSSEKNEN